MRGLILFFFAVSVFEANAQKQERKLLDRLLRPDTTLQNAAQNKRFIATATSIDKNFPIGSFYVAEKSITKKFPAAREISAKEYATPRFRYGNETANLATRTELAKRANVDSGTGILMIRNAPESDKKIAGTEFAGSRPFLDQGKSQKAISQHDTPLTIEQVRELLNKNK